MSESTKSESANHNQPAPDPPARSATTHDVPTFGWSHYAERINGRFAMVGLIAVVLIELLSGSTFLQWIGMG